ncbi:MAG: transketolase [Acidimicrobiia bacterium]|nr:transketolase [Acidimicrobiia bacterium]
MTTAATTDLRPDLVVLPRTVDIPSSPNRDTDAINALRFLAADAVELAGSGHPGTAMALAPLAYRLYTRHVRNDPTVPDWFDRDRVVLSIGHASMLLYGALHLAGYDVAIDDLRNFRQWGSRTPGHPERDATPGIDINTGPLGQGVANGVGFAMAERMLASRFNRPGMPVIDHRTWVIAGDGDMMEGLSSEAASLAGRLGLDKLTVFYDDNRISLEGARDVEFCEDVPERFRAYGWQVLHVGCVNDLDAIDAAVTGAVADTTRPSLVVVGSNIGYGSPKQDTAAAHGSPLGADAIRATRTKLGWHHEPFVIPSSVYDHWRSQMADRVSDHGDADTVLVAYRAAWPELAAELDRVMSGSLPAGWSASLPTFPAGDRVSGRDASGRALNALAAVIPELVGGSADVAPSTKTQIIASGDVNAGDWAGRSIHFGVREHAMGAICNAIAAHGGLRPYCATFFVFSDYLRPAIRMAALMQLPVIFVMTHDSIGVGEDGPTHQPIEHLASLRAIPGLRVIRPGDANEVAQAWRVALDHLGPTVLVMSRQDMLVLEPDLPDVASGAAVVAAGNEVTIVATGSEVELALDARALLAGDDISARVVSMPSWELFRELPAERRDAIVPPTTPSVSVEAGATQGWFEFVDHPVGIDHFGASAPADILYREYGLTPVTIAAQARNARSRRSKSSKGNHS